MSKKYLASLVVFLALVFVASAPLALAKGGGSGSSGGSSGGNSSSSFFSGLDSLNDLFERDLSVGITNSDGIHHLDVANLQNALKSNGFFHDSISGNFDSSTHQAVIDFQRQHGLPTTGFVGPLTRNLLNSRSGADSVRDQLERNLFVGITNNDGTAHLEVAHLQAELEREGFFHGPITGNFGPLTRQAVIDFQREHSLPMTGIVGSLTREALNKASGLHP